MKYLLFLFCFLVPAHVHAQSAEGKRFEVKTTLLHVLQAAQQHYDAATDSLINNAQKIGEHNFWLGYRRLMYVNREQFAKAEAFTRMSDEGLSKATKQAADQLEHVSWNAAMQELNSRWSHKKLKKKYIPDYRYMVALAAAGADYKTAVRLNGHLLQSGLARFTDSLDQVDYLAASFQVNEALSLNEMLWHSHASDTLGLGRIACQRGLVYKAQMDSAQALGNMVEAVYLLQRLVATEDVRLLQVRVLIDLSRLQNAANDFSGALAHAKNAVSIVPAEDTLDRARALMMTGIIYQRAGAPKEAEDALQSAYEILLLFMPHHFEAAAPLMADIIDAYAVAEKWYDKDKRYEQLLKEVAGIRENLSAYGVPFFRLEWAGTLHVLGQKYMNVDVKIGPAEEAWIRAGAILEPLVAENIVLTGDLICDNYYKLAGCKAAFKKNEEAKAVFRKSLAVRERLYAIAPKAYARDLATVQIQNANFDAQEKNFTEALQRLKVAEEKANEIGDKHMRDEIRNFRDYLREKISK